jgi:hypothetical protein
MSTSSNVATILNIDAYRGDTLLRTVRVKDRKTKQRLPLTGASVLMQLRETPESPTVLYTFTTTIAKSVVNGTTTNDDEIRISIPSIDWGVIDTIMALPSTIVKEWDDGKNKTKEYILGVFDLQLTYSGGIVETLFRGQFTVIGDTSRNV